MSKQRNKFFGKDGFSTLAFPSNNVETRNKRSLYLATIAPLAIALSMLLVGPKVLYTGKWLLPQTAQAVEPGQRGMQLTLTVDKRVEIEGQTGASRFEWQPLSPSVPVLPGEILRYRLVGKNNSSQSLSAFVVTQPIPPQMIYILDSVAGANNITFSIDQGQTFIATPTVTNVNENGQAVRQAAPAEVYTHIRWEFDQVVAPGEELVGTFQVKVR